MNKLNHRFVHEFQQRPFQSHGSAPHRWIFQAWFGRQEACRANVVFTLLRQERFPAIRPAVYRLLDSAQIRCMERSFHRRSGFERYFLEEMRQQAFHFRPAKRAGRTSFSNGKSRFFPIVRKKGNRFFKSGKVRHREPDHRWRENTRGKFESDNYFGTGGERDAETSSTIRLISGLVRRCSESTRPALQKQDTGDHIHHLNAEGFRDNGDKIPGRNISCQVRENQYCNNNLWAYCFRYARTIELSHA